MIKALLSIALALLLTAGWWAVLSADSTPPCEVDVITHGTVRYVKVESGCWKFEGDDGRNYELLTGNARILRDGIEGTLFGDVHENIGTFCQVGLPTSVCKFEVDHAEIALGTLRFECIEGGCWVFTTGGRSFQPLARDPEFYRHDVTMKVRYIRRHDLLSFCQVGPIIEILEFATDEEGEEPPDCITPFPVEADWL